MANTQPYLEHFLDNLENLSPELTRNFKLIYEIDLRVYNTLAEIDRLKKDYIQNFKSFDQTTRLDKMKFIDKKYEKVKQFGDEKVQLANQTYELVDKHIRRLDTDLARFEAELKERSINRRSGEHTEGLDTTETSTGAHNLSTISSASVGASTEGTSKRKKKKIEQPTVIIEETEAALPISSLALTLAQPADVLDMPVDPNEPTYCLCNQVSYGEMIGCDNHECPIEWFHFGCVGLTTKPKGKWYCPMCLEKRKKT